MCVVYNTPVARQPVRKASRCLLVCLCFVSSRFHCVPELLYTNLNAKNTEFLTDRLYVPNIMLVQLCKAFYRPSILPKNE